MTNGTTGALPPTRLETPGYQLRRRPAELDADEPAVVEAEACAVTVAETACPTTRSRRPADRPPARLDPAAMADDQGGGAVGHSLHDARPDAPMGLGDGGEPTAPSE
jgi:hypothetical protein